MNQFLISKEVSLKADILITLSDEEAHHVRDVHRHKVNETIQVTNGQQSFYAQIISISKDDVVIRLMNEIKIIKNGSLEIAPALLKGDTIEWVFEKCVELGVDVLQPLTTSRTIVQESPNKRARWEKIIDAAVKQCGTPLRPTLQNTTPLDEFLKKCTADIKIIFWESGGKTLDQVFTDRALIYSTHCALLVQSSVGRALSRYNLSSGLGSTHTQKSPHVCALIGPEGGFSEAEATQAQAAGFIPVFLGQRILRAETAAIVAASLIQNKLGNL